MIKNLISCYIFLCSFLCFTQEFNITGSVKNENNEPIAYANAVIIDIANSLPIEGTITNESGYFIINNLKAGDYILKISFLGYKTYSTRVELDRNIDFETITLNEDLQELEGVTIVAKKPTVKRMVDRLVFNFENSTLSNNNVLDLLKYTPGVLVHNEEITIKNSTPTVYINDRRVHLSSDEVQQLLESTPANNIKSIEVITNPPAKYDAEGGAVINIVTSKNIIAGYNGSVFGNYKQGSEFPKYTFGTSHFFKTKKLNTYLNYSINPRKDYWNYNEFINFIENDQIVYSWETDFKRSRKTTNQNINANIDYEIDEHNSIGFSTNILIAPRNNTKTNVNSLTEIFGIGMRLDSIFNTTNLKVDETFNLGFNLEFIHKFKKEGETLSISTHHTNYDFSSFQNVDTGYFLPNIENTYRDNRFQTFSSQRTKLYTGQVDYNLPISESKQFASGLKLSSINSKSILDQFIYENDVKIEDLQNSDIFLYNETNYAAYTSYTIDWDKWRLKSGLRVELTNIDGNSISTNQISNANYTKFFPSFYLLKRINTNDEIYFSYNKRIYRPRYSQLNPFKYFLNDNTYIIGDPNLRPQIDDQFILGYTFKKDYTFEMYFRNEKNPTLEFIFQDNVNNQLVYKNTNSEASHSYGLDFTTYKQILPQWNIYILSSLFYYENKFFTLEETNNELFFTDKWSIYAEIINYFSFLKDKSLTAEVSYLHMSPTIEGPTFASTTAGLDINIMKTFRNNRSSLSIGVTDVFDTKNFNLTTKYYNQDSFIKTKRENRMIVFGFKYKFGNFRLNSNKKEIELNERERLN